VPSSGSSGGGCKHKKKEQSRTIGIREESLGGTKWLWGGIFASKKAGFYFEEELRGGGGNFNPGGRFRGGIRERRRSALREIEEVDSASTGEGGT